MKIKIVKKGNSKLKQTSFGEKNELTFMCNVPEINDGKDFWATVYEGLTTSNWREGMIVEADIVPRDYQGKKYYSIKLPKIDYRKPATTQPQNNDDIKEILERVKKIEAMINNLTPTASGIGVDDFPFGE
jgi:hypothetical protein